MAAFAVRIGRTNNHSASMCTERRPDDIAIWRARRGIFLRAAPRRRGDTPLNRRA
jgi:hypothetical protein